MPNSTPRTNISATDRTSPNRRTLATAACSAPEAYTKSFLFPNLSERWPPTMAGTMPPARTASPQYPASVFGLCTPMTWRKYRARNG